MNARQRFPECGLNEEKAGRRLVIMKSRQPAVAGTFYSADKGVLREQVDTFLDEAQKETVAGKLKALIVPHAGLMYSGIVAAAGYKLLRKQVKDKKIKAERIIIIGPAHTIAFNGCALDENEQWLTPLGKTQIEAIDLSKGKFKALKVLSEAHLHEHSIEVQLPFIQTILGSKVKVIPVVAGFVDEELFSEDLERLLDKNSFLVISSDLSHYHEYNTATRIDSGTNKRIIALDSEGLKESGDACGITGIIALVYLAKRLGWKAKLLDYKNSGDTSGAMNSVVGYASIAFYEEKERKK